MAGGDELEPADPLGVAEHHLGLVPVAVDHELPGVHSTHIEILDLFKTKQKFLMTFRLNKHLIISTYLLQLTAVIIFFLMLFALFIDIWKAVDPCQEHQRSPPRPGSSCCFHPCEYLRFSSVRLIPLVTSKIW